MLFCIHLNTFCFLPFFFLSKTVRQWRFLAIPIPNVLAGWMHDNTLEKIYCSIKFYWKSVCYVNILVSKLVISKNICLLFDSSIYFSICFVHFSSRCLHYVIYNCSFVIQMQKMLFKLKNSMISNFGKMKECFDGLKKMERIQNKNELSIKKKKCFQFYKKFQFFEEPIEVHLNKEKPFYNLGDVFTHILNGKKFASASTHAQNNNQTCDLRLERTYSFNWHREQLQSN